MCTRVLLVDDHEAIRRGIRTILGEHPLWSVCGEAADGVDGLAKARTLKPDIVLMDISMPRMDGLAATRILRRELPATQIIIITQNDPQVAREQAREVDASGYIQKCDLPEKLISTLQSLAISR